MEHFMKSEIKLEETTDYTILSAHRLRNDKKNIINKYKNQEIYISWNSKRTYIKDWFTKDYGILWLNGKIYDLDLHKKYF